MPRRQKAEPLTALNADPYDLYQRSVQTPDVEIEMLNKMYRKLRGRLPLTLREDFCGTALLCADWVKSRPDRTATGIDLDPVPLKWGREHNIAPVGEAAKRITIHQKNVLDVRSGGFDIGVAFNFSYWVFKKRADMLAYFKAVHASLGKEGMFCLDFYGGWEAGQEIEESRRVVSQKGDGGFWYLWDQSQFNPIDSSAVNHIHFRFKDGSRLQKAFTYEWRLWSIIEIRELLLEAGFSKEIVYWEDEDEDRDGTGVWRPKTRAPNDPGWLAYVVGLK
jgi:hypothetical protein